MNKLKKFVMLSLAVILSITSINVKRNIVQAFTPPLITNSGITYPISLDTGKDAAGKLVFPDKEFLKYISNTTFQSGNYYGKKFDLNHDGKLSKEECELVRVIGVAGNSDIKSLSGIEAFPKLRELYCNNTGITELNLSNNPRLQILSCASTKIKELNVSECTMLKELKFSGCSVGAVDLTKNTNLSYLVCSNQEIDTYEYQNDGRYCVSLEDINKILDLSKVSDVKIDGAYGDDINSGYDSEKGLVWCSDEIKTITYTYKLDLKSKTEAMDEVLNVTLNLKNGIREGYESLGGSRVIAQFVEKDSIDMEPENPVKEGCMFTGWYTDKECSENSKWKFGQQLTGNITLYAGWKNKEYKVIYKTEGEQVNVTNVDWWTKNLLPNITMSKTGYNLTGWKAETGIIVNDGNNSQVTYGQASGNDAGEATTLSAVWEPKSGYKLKLSTNIKKKLKRKMEGSIKLETDNDFNWEQNNILNQLDAGQIPGYTLTGWYTAKKGGTKITKNTTFGDIYISCFKGDDNKNIPTLYARYDKTKYTIKYNTRGGNWIKSRKNIKWGSKIPLPKKKPKKKGYKFKGWKLEGKKVKKGMRLRNENSYYCWRKSLTLKAVWKKKK